MKKYYVIVKTVICDIKGDACEMAEDIPYKDVIVLDCEHCPYYIEWKKKHGLERRRQR